MYIVEREINDYLCRFLAIKVDNCELIIGYIDNFDKVHFYASK